MLAWLEFIGQGHVLVRKRSFPMSPRSLHGALPQVSCEVQAVNMHGEIPEDVEVITCYGVES